MEITEHFAVSQAADSVWAMFDDIPSVVACLPGVEMTELVNDHTIRGRMQVKLGPMQPAFEGEAIIERDESSRQGVIRAKGIDKRGGSRAEAVVSYKVAEDGPGALVDIVAEIKLMGQLAQFGRAGILRDVSAQLTGEFVRCLEAKLAATTPDEAAAVTAADVRPVMLILTTTWARLVRFFRSLFGRND